MNFSCQDYESYENEICFIKKYIYKLRDWYIINLSVSVIEFVENHHMMFIEKNIIKNLSLNNIPLNLIL